MCLLSRLAFGTEHLEPAPSPGSPCLIRVHGYFAACQVGAYLEQRGIRVLNAAAHVELFGQKVKTDGWLLEHEVSPIPGGFAFSKETAGALADGLGYPVVMKPNIGGFGHLVHWIDTARNLASACDQLAEFAPAHHRTFYLQKALDVARDVRVLLLHGKVVCAVRRNHRRETANNLSRGRGGTPHDLLAEEREVVSRLGEELRRGFFGIDLLTDTEGRVYVCELNAVCRFVETSRISGIDVAGRLLEEGFRDGSSASSELPRAQPSERS